MRQSSCVVYNDGARAVGTGDACWLGWGADGSSTPRATLAATSALSRASTDACRRRRVDSSAVPRHGAYARSRLQRAGPRRRARHPHRHAGTRALHAVEGIRPSVVTRTGANRWLDFGSELQGCAAGLAKCLAG